MPGRGVDRQRLAGLFDRYRGRMERTALRILPEQSDAEDAVQNALVQIIRHFEKLDEIPDENVSFWILSIVRNEALVIRRGQRRTAPLEDWDAFAAEAEDVTGWRELTALFAKLPDTYRAAMEMKLLIGYTDREIAEKLGISKAAASSRVNRGRALLRELAVKEGFHP